MYVWGWSNEKAKGEEEYVWDFDDCGAGSKSASGVTQPSKKRRRCSGITTALSTRRTTSRPTRPTTQPATFRPIHPLQLPLLILRQLQRLEELPSQPQLKTPGRVHMPISLPYPTHTIAPSHHKYRALPCRLALTLEQASYRLFGNRKK